MAARCKTTIRFLTAALAVLLLATAMGRMPTGETEIAAAATPTDCYRQAVAATLGLRGYWRLGEAIGTTAVDSSGQANDGTYSSGVSLGGAGAITGDANTSATFDGTTGDVQVPDSASLDTADSFTYEAWVRKSVLGGLQTVMSKNQGAAWLGFHFDHLMLVRDDVGPIATADAPTLDTGWHHVAATKSGSDIHLYIDGVDRTGSIEANPETVADSSTPLTIGSGLTYEYFNGSIDEAAVYGRPLSAAEIANHHVLGAGCPVPPAPSTPSKAQTPTPPAGPATEDDDQPTAEPSTVAALPPKTVRLGQRPVTLTKSGIARLKLSCAKARGRCKGRVEIYTREKRRARKASTSARKKVVLGKARFRIKAGRSAVVKVRISRRARRRLARKRKQRCRISIRVDGRSYEQGLTIRRARRGHS